MLLLYNLLALSLWVPLLLAEKRIDRATKAMLVKEAWRSASHQAAIGEPIKMFDAQRKLVERAKSEAVNEYPLTYSDELYSCMRDNVSDPQ